MGKNDIDVVGILNWATQQRDKFEADKPKVNRRGFRQYRQQSPMDKLFNDFLEDQLRSKFKEMDDKLNKKEDKKEEKKGWDALSFMQKIAVLTTTVPIGMMGMIILVLEFVKIVKLM